MSTPSKWLVPFSCALVASPLFVLLHEIGHYVAGVCLGFSATLHYDQVTGTMPKEALTWRGDALQASAGPLVQFVLAVAGFAWLRSLRQHRREAAVTMQDWLATVLIGLNAGHWLQGVADPFGYRQLIDEARVSGAIGLRPTVLPCLFAFLAVVALLATMQLHPPGSRLLPFLSMAAGGAIGFFVWIRLAGPLLLP